MKTPVIMPSLLTSGDDIETYNPVDVKEQNFSGYNVSSGVTSANDNGQFGVDGSHHEEVGGFFAFVNPVTLGIVLAVGLAGVLICVVTLVWFCIKCRRQKLLSFDGSEESRSIKSAPTSRITSPKLNKCKSCPDALSIKLCTQDILAQSRTSKGISELTVQPECVQPGGSLQKYGTNFGRILYQKKYGAASVTPDPCRHQSFSEDNEQETSCGQLWFSLTYHSDTEQLQIHLLKVEDLPGRNNNSHSRDPYVKIFLMPYERTCQVSQVKKNTLNPVFNETHTFQVTAVDVKKRVLRFSVYDVDRRHVLHSLGHAVICLKDLDLSKSDVMQRKLEPMIRAASIGELQFGLVYLPSSEKIKIAFYSAKNLHYMENFPEMETCICVQLYYGHKCHRVKHTVAHQRGAEITFNETVTFTISGKLLDTCNLKISMMLMSSNICAASKIEYGQVVVGPFMFARGDELAHWQEMLSHPGLASTHWHNLTSRTFSP